MRDIRNEIKSLGEEIGASIFGLTSYKDKSNRDSPCYTFGKEGAMQLALKYAKARRKVIKPKVKRYTNIYREREDEPFHYRKTGRTL